MMWNWQQPDWTDFQFRKSRLDPREARFLHSAGVVLGATQHLDAATTEQLRIEHRRKDYYSALQQASRDHVVAYLVCRHRGRNPEFDASEG